MAFNSLFLYTKYLFINKTGLEILLKTPNSAPGSDLTMSRMEIEEEIFENQRKSIRGEFVEPFLQNDIPCECDRTHRYKPRSWIRLPNNNKWRWKTHWMVTDWEYAKDFNYSFHKTYDSASDEVRRRKWSRIRVPKYMKMLSTTSAFGGSDLKNNNKVMLRVVETGNNINSVQNFTSTNNNNNNTDSSIAGSAYNYNIETNRSTPIPLSDAVVANDVLRIKHPRSNKIFFDIGIQFELHRFYPAIKVLKFYPRYVAINLTSNILNLHLRPCVHIMNGNVASSSSNGSSRGGHRRSESTSFGGNDAIHSSSGGASGRSSGSFQGRSSVSFLPKRKRAGTSVTDENIFGGSSGNLQSLGNSGGSGANKAYEVLNEMKDTERIIEAYTSKMPPNYDEIAFGTH